MSTQSITQNREIYKFIFSFISDKLACNTGDIVSRRTTVSSEALFLALVENYNISESEFVQLLNELHNKFPMKYKQIKVLKKWNGGSKHAIPEAYPDENKINCLVKKEIYAKEFYDDVDENRKWSAGKFVWIPKKHPKLKEYIDNDYIHLVA